MKKSSIKTKISLIVAALVFLGVAAMTAVIFFSMLSKSAADAREKLTEMSDRIGLMVSNVLDIPTVFVSASAEQTAP